MVKIIISRIVSTLGVLLGVSAVVFFSLKLVPGDPARTILGFSATEERVQALRATLGLDAPIVTQYLTWLWNLLHGDLGQSLTLGAPVMTVILDKIGASLILMAASLAIVVVFGLVLASVSGGHRKSGLDRLIVIIMLVFASVPPFWLGIVLLYVFSLKLGLFPVSGMYDMADPGGLGDLLAHLVLPAITTAVSSLAVVTRVTRSKMIDVMQQPYVTMARTRGLSEKRIIYVEALRNTLPTFTSISGLQIGYLFGSVMFSEIIFNWPGIGLQLYQAIIARDYLIVQGAVLAVAIVFVLGNLVADLLAAALDTRRRAR